MAMRAASWPHGASSRYARYDGGKVLTAICKRHKAIAVAAVAAAAVRGLRRDIDSFAARTGVPEAKIVSAKAKTRTNARMRNYP